MIVVYNVDGLMTESCSSPHTKPVVVDEDDLYPIFTEISNYHRALRLTFLSVVKVMIHSMQLFDCNAVDELVVSTE
jgi:hypothetical protein